MFNRDVSGLISRLFFIALGPLVAVGAVGCQSTPARVESTSAHSYSIMQGVTSADATRFSVVTPEGDHPSYTIRLNGVDRAVAATRVRGPDRAYAVDQLRVDGLRPGVTYELRVSRGGRLVDRRSFESLDLGKAHARVAVISCMDDRMSEAARQMWPQVLGQGVDALVLIGDNVYADHAAPGPHWRTPGPVDLWRRYVETRNQLPLYFADHLVPTVATWDDHDFAHNDADSTYPYREDSLKTFLAFFPQGEAAVNFARGPGVSSWWRAFGVEWALLDDRYYRTPNKVDRADQSHFGVEQERWLLENLGRAERPVLLTSGDQFFGGYHPNESYEGSHPRSFARALVEWRAAARTPVLFVSGDRHLTEIMRVPETVLGYPTFEVTSSGIHTAVFPGAFARAPSPRQLVGVAGQLNYSIFEFMRTDSNLLRVSIQSFAPNETLLYQRTLTVKRP